MDTMSIIRSIVTLASFICFVAWIVWFLNKDNKDYYQAQAQALLDDDDSVVSETTPVLK